MSKELSSKSFVINPKDGFEGYGGFEPTPKQLEIIFKIEPGAVDLLFDIFSENHYQDKYRNGKRD